MIKRMHAMQLAGQLCLMANDADDARIIARYLLDLVDNYLAPSQGPAKPALRVVVPIREEGDQA